MANTGEDGLAIRPSTSYGRFGIVGCGVVVAFVLIVVLLILTSLYRTPYFRNITDCRIGIEEVGSALQRYAIKNDRYPEKLSDLVPDYIRAKKLHCPADEPPTGAISYKYTRQPLDAPDKAVLLICDHHKLKSSSLPAVTLQYLKNGHVVMVNEGKD